MLNNQTAEEEREENIVSGFSILDMNTLASEAMLRTNTEVVKNVIGKYGKRLSVISAENYIELAEELRNL